jgi:hypothetical protein
MVLHRDGESMAFSGIETDYPEVSGINQRGT